MSRYGYSPAGKVLPVAKEIEQPKDLQLTDREWEVVNQVLQGKSNQEISDTLYLNCQSVKNLMHIILRKAGCTNRDQLRALLASGSVAVKRSKYRQRSKNSYQ